MADCVSCDG